VSLDKLRDKALKHIAEREVRYTISLDPEVTLKLNMLRRGIERAAAEAATRPPGTMPSTKRRTLADTMTETEKAVAELDAEVAKLLEQAREDDSLVVVRFGIPAAARDDIAGYFEATSAKYDALGGRSAHADEIKRELVVVGYLATESPAGESLDFDWATVSTKVLGHADLENLDADVLDLYRSTSAIPFDLANYSTPLQS